MFMNWSRKNVLGCAIASVLTLSGAVSIVAWPENAQAEVKVSGEAAATLNDLSKEFRQVAKAVEPSVVNIKVRKVIEAPKGRAGANGAPNPMQDPFFRRFMDPNGDGDSDGDGGPGFPGMPFPGQGGELIGQGSGVIMEVQGKTAYIVTNNHVAGDADEIEVVLNDGRTITNGKLVGSDPRTDIAVLKIEADNLKAANWGNSDEVEKGDWVLAFGSPFGYVGSMTHGIVSALNRTDLQIIPQGYEQFIQIDAPINPGNSGGPLANIRGDVIGINTAIASRTGGFQGIGFAIPSNLARQIANTLKDNGKIVRGWLGVGIASVDEGENRQVARSFGYKNDTGVLVQQVFPNTPAYEQLKEGDVITKLDGKDIADSNALRNRIAMLAPGTEVSMAVFRDGKDETVKIKLGDQPANLAAVDKEGGAEGQPDAARNGSPRMGVTLQDVSPDLARRLGLKPDQEGALVTKVEPRSAAAKANVRVGDVITKVGPQAVRSAFEALSAIKKSDLRAGVRLYIVGREGSRFVFVQVAEKHNGESK